LAHEDGGAFAGDVSLAGVTGLLRDEKFGGPLILALPGDYIKACNGPQQPDLT